MITKNTEALIVSATAGSGKTTTIIDGINYAVTGMLPEKYTPSSEQTAIWDWMDERIDRSCEVIFLAFNKSIATELQERLSFGTASTLHALGYRILRESKVKCKVNNWKTANLFQAFAEVKSIRDLTPEQRLILDDVKYLVSACKDLSLTEDDITTDRLKLVAMDRGYQASCVFEVLVPYVKYILEEGSKLSTSKYSKFIEIDFDDMVYLPTRYNLKTAFDVIIVDEAQDLSKGKLNLLLQQDCTTYVFVGDPNQAIYAFAGADSQSFASIAEAIPNNQVLPLSYTYRCGKKIVDEARKLVGSAINAGDSNPEGVIHNIKSDEMDLTEGDMLLSRVNAPLMTIAWSLVRQKKTVKVVGRDIGDNLIKLIKSLSGKGSDKIEKSALLIQPLNNWYQKQLMILQNKPFDTSSQEIALADQLHCIEIIISETETVDEMIEFINELFDYSSDMECVRLSSIHKAKGLESDRVFLYDPSKIPHPMAKTDEAKLQEKNLLFVAITRAIKELYYVAVIKV